VLGVPQGEAGSSSTKQLIATLHIGASSDAASTDAEDGVCAPVHTGREHVRTHFSSATDHRRRRGMQKARQLTSGDGWRLTVSSGIAAVDVAERTSIESRAGFKENVLSVPEQQLLN